MVEDNNTYRIEIRLQGYYTDGFLELFHQSEILYNKKEFEESLENIIINCKKYMKNRVK